MMLTQATKEAFILIVVAVGVALAVYALRPDKIGTIPAAAGPQTAVPTATAAGVAEMSMAEALRFFEEKRAVFADARHRVDFEAGHIRGAVNLYAVDQDAWLNEFLATSDPATVVITYCDGPDCHLATELAELLFNNGFERVHYLENGWSRWRDAGYPADKH